MSLRMVEAVVACGFSILLFASLIVPFLLSCQSSGYEVYILEATYKDPAVSLCHLTVTSLVYHHFKLSFIYCMLLSFNVWFYYVQCKNFQFIFLPVKFPVEIGIDLLGGILHVKFV